MKFALNMTDFAFKMMNLVLQMMDFDRISDVFRTLGVARQRVRRTRQLQVIVLLNMTDFLLKHDGFSTTDDGFILNMMDLYSWNQQPYNATRANAIGFKTNWDLSGTWMPYDGLFLPYIEEWPNLGPINGGLKQVTGLHTANFY